MKYKLKHAVVFKGVPYESGDEIEATEDEIKRIKASEPKSKPKAQTEE